MKLNQSYCTGYLDGLKVAAAVVEKASSAGKRSNHAYAIRRRATVDQIMMSKWQRDERLNNPQDNGVSERGLADMAGYSPNDHQENIHPKINEVFQACAISAAVALVLFIILLPIQ